MKWHIRADETPLYSWDNEWEYRFMDMMPQFNNATKMMTFSQKQNGNSAIVKQSIDGSDYSVVFDPYQTEDSAISAWGIATGNAGCQQPSFTADGEWITFSLGWWFQNRTNTAANVFRVRSNGSDWEQLTGLDDDLEELNSGYSSFSPDGTQIVYRVMGPSHRGLRIFDIAKKSYKNLTTGWDNMPAWSPDGQRIVFTRRNNATGEDNITPWDPYDVWTIQPDGNNATQLTTALGNDGHAVWANDGRILFSTSRYGFRGESANYDNTFQPYGVAMVMNADGTDQKPMTDSLWEDAMPQFAWNDVLQ